MDKVFLILGDQLFPPAKTPLKSDEFRILMIEDYGLCTHYKYHQHKIAFFLLAMRDYADDLRSKDYQVDYFDGDHRLFKKSFEEKVAQFLKGQKKIKQVHIYEVSDHFFAKRLEEFFSEMKIELVIHKTPMFFTSKDQFKNYLSTHKKPFMMTFYQQQRQRLQMMMTAKGEPAGGQWSFDKDNRKKYPKSIELPDLPSPKVSPHFEAVENLVNAHFKDHPGDLKNFWLPTSRREALQWTKTFVEKKSSDFGPYEDAIKSDNVFGFHSVLSPLINAGLITPDEPVGLMIESWKNKKTPIASTEGYVRQMIGWREFMKGMYDNYIEKMESENFWGHNRKLKDTWYRGETGLPPLDDSIKKASHFGYTHHIERLMILSNCMLLCELHPRQVHQWFMEMFVDSADWVMAGNVYGMGQMSEGGLFATKPYICGSNYIIKMSDYKKGDWCDTLDGLYWRFIDKHKKVFGKNPRMGMMVKMLDKIDQSRKKHIFSQANRFIEANTKGA